ncbi:MAG: ATP-binding protein [Chloroflexi bacterium]|nr:ATP-binding protein [Chloroflexota bacterium]
MISGLQRFFETNAVIVFFVYGLVFFTLGLAIALQSRSHSRLELARNLGWLAAFGLSHGLHEWGWVFIPIQAGYLPEAGISFLISLQTILLGLSFAFLLQFGAELLRRRWPRLAALPLAIFMLWLFWFFMPGIARYDDIHTLHTLASIWARYLIAVPAGILSAIGVRYHVDRFIVPLGLAGIARTLRVASLALVAYAIFGGLVVPPAGFPPASWLNDATFTAWLGFPPPVIRSLAGLALTLATIRSLEVFDIEVNQLIEQAQVERELVEERERIARELHDGTIQTIYTAGLLLESASRNLAAEPKEASRLERAGRLLNEAIADLRNYIGNLKPSAAGDTLESIIQSQTEDVRLNSLVEVRLDMALESERPFHPARLPHVAAFLSEALSNAVRHSGGKRVQVRAALAAGNLELTVEDSGRGFDPAHARAGYGLRNMRDRARLLGGALEIQSQPGKGARITLRAPWREDP